jgi:phosphoglycerate dehydrogenase-like enzyme
MVGEVDAVLHLSRRPLSREFLAQFANLSALAVIGATEELIETPMSETPDLVLIGTASWEVEDAAEHALSLLYTARFELADQTCPERDPGWVSAHSFKGAKVGIVGLGALGSALATQVSALRMDVAWWDPRPKDAPWPRAESLLALADYADILLVACPIAPSTRGLVTKAVIDALGSRGLLLILVEGAVDERALTDALCTGRLGSAVLITTNQEGLALENLASAPNLLLTSRDASLTVVFLVKCAESAVMQLCEHFGGDWAEFSRKALREERLEALRLVIAAQVGVEDLAIQRRH